MSAQPDSGPSARWLDLRRARQGSAFLPDGETEFESLRAHALEIPAGVDSDSKSSENRSMKTTVDIPENELKDAMRFTKAKTKREAVVKVLEEFNRRRRMAELVKYAGSFSDRFPTNDDIEAVDIARDGALHGRPRR